MLDRRTLPLSALRAFESAGRHLHMGRAGEELGVTHGIPAITRPEHVSRLLLHDNQNNWSRWFAAMDVPEPGNVKQLHFYSTSLSLTAARLGFGIALCNPFEIQEDLLQGRLVKLLKKEVPETHNFYLLTNHAEHRSLRAQLFEDWIKSQTRVNQ